MSVKFCTLASGSKGNCHFISDGDNYLLFDAGLSGVKIQKRLIEIGIKPEQLTGIVISHEHNDHIQGAGILSRRFDIPLYANEGTWDVMKNKIGEIKLRNMKVFSTGKLFELNSFIVNPFKISHDAREPVGFSIENNGVNICIATDLGYVDETLIKHTAGADLVVLESNHDEEMLKAGRYPYSLKRRILSEVGHLSNENAGLAILKMIDKNVKKIILAHLSEENNFPELAYETVKNVLERNNVSVEKDINLYVAHRDSKVHEFKQKCLKLAFA
ncbi:MAG: MBL fold metallo-hydrolase [Alkaliphilus sp.]|nr:MBL fold metallo-hydrolase [bacterium AH-315-G05]PHS36072.1 MAG: MBL fold metallo-hydrolase [Alkaliphilus sp.]